MSQTGRSTPSSVRPTSLLTQPAALLVRKLGVIIPVSNDYMHAGSVPAVFIMESIIDQVASTLSVDVDVVRKMNLYKDGQVMYVRR